MNDGTRASGLYQMFASLLSHAMSTHSRHAPLPPPSASPVLRHSLAYRSLHEASTVLLPSGCPLCRRNRTRAVATGAERKSSRASVVEVAKRNAKVADGLKVARSAEAAGEGVMKAMDTSGAGFLPKVAAAPPTPHCDICELSARVVMRGVALMERDKDYDNAFHYLEILLQVCMSIIVRLNVLALTHDRSVAELLYIVRYFL